MLLQNKDKKQEYYFQMNWQGSLSTINMFWSEGCYRDISKPYFFFITFRDMNQQFSSWKRLKLFYLIPNILYKL